MPDYDPFKPQQPERKTVTRTYYMGVPVRINKHYTTPEGLEVVEIRFRGGATFPVPANLVITVDEVEK